MCACGMSGGNDVQARDRAVPRRRKTADKGRYRHFMLKEIHEQPASCSAPWKAASGRTGNG